MGIFLIAAQHFVFTESVFMVSSWLVAASSYYCIFAFKKIVYIFVTGELTLLFTLPSASGRYECFCTDDDIGIFFVVGILSILLLLLVFWGPWL
jgi:hypothetical protein